MERDVPGYNVHVHFINFTEHSPSWEAMVVELVNTFSVFMEPDCSLPCSQEPATRPYFESLESSSHPATLFL
jgi:hypothetical protein